MRTIEQVLDEMVGVNYMATEAQIEEIRDLRRAEAEANEARIRAAYEAGRKHDLAELGRILGGGGS